MNFTALRALIIDIDGTLLRGEKPLPGLSPFFAFLNQNKITFVVATNNATKTPQTYWQELSGAGARIAPHNILTCALATADYLRQEFSTGTGVYVVGTASLQSAIRQAGFAVLTDATRPAGAVVVGGDPALTYDKLKYATLQIQRGARFIGTNPDVLYPTEEGLVPEAGATLAAIQAATGISPTVIGKPNRPLFEMALARTGSQPQETAMLGDRLETDILGAQQAGLKSILVTTGVASQAGLAATDIQPDAVFSGLVELTEAWQQSMPIR
jgi:4-nitrophenyl phosphatase